MSASERTDSDRRESTISRVARWANRLVVIITFGAMVVLFFTTLSPAMTPPHYPPWSPAYTPPFAGPIISTGGKYAIAAVVIALSIRAIIAVFISQPEAKA